MVATPRGARPEEMEMEANDLTVCPRCGRSGEMLVRSQAAHTARTGHEPHELCGLCASLAEALETLA